MWTCRSVKCLWCLNFVFLNQVPLFLQCLKEHQMLKARLNFFAVLWFVDRLLLAAGKEKRKSQNKGSQKHLHDCFITDKIQEYKCQMFWQSCAAAWQCSAVMFMCFPKSMTQYSLINKTLGFCLSTNYTPLTYVTVGKLLYLKTIINFGCISRIRVASWQ